MASRSSLRLSTDCFRSMLGTGGSYRPPGTECRERVPRGLECRTMASASGNASIPPLRWFSAADVTAAMPDIDERLRLAQVTMTALARPGAAQLPPKIAIHPRPEASFVHAMPAHLRGDDAHADLVGMKWVSGYATNTASGLPGIHAVVVLNDPATG